MLAAVFEAQLLTERRAGVTIEVQSAKCLAFLSNNFNDLRHLIDGTSISRETSASWLRGSFEDGIESALEKLASVIGQAIRAYAQSRRGSQRARKRAQAARVKPSARIFASGFSAISACTHCSSS
jgi:hypothetical protein